jgi:hypothetical protein
VAEALPGLVSGRRPIGSWHPTLVSAVRYRPSSSSSMVARDSQRRFLAAPSSAVVPTLGVDRSAGRSSAQLLGAVDPPTPARFPMLLRATNRIRSRMRGKMRANLRTHRLCGSLAARGKSPSALEPRCIPPGLRCSSFEYAQCAPSSRPASWAPRRSQRYAEFHHGLLVCRADTLGVVCDCGRER